MRGKHAAHRPRLAQLALLFLVVFCGSALLDAVWDGDSALPHVMWWGSQPASGGQEPAADAGGPRWRARQRLLITYLAQKRHSSYGHDSLHSLAASLDLLYANIMPWSQADVLVFHEGDFTAADQAGLSRGRPELHFILMPPGFWRLPGYLRAEDHRTWSHLQYSVGYRHMVRWYALHLFTFCAEAGYEWVLRLDQDSFVRSPVRFDLVKRMDQGGLLYGYRADTHNYPTVTRGFPEAVRAYLVMSGRQPTFLLKHSSPQTLDGLAAAGWSRAGYYNNFFITQAAFWQRADVQHFLNFIDRTGGVYTQRWGDLLVQTAAVQIFLRESEVHKFTEFTYEHATTTSDNVLLNGGIVAGTDDALAQQQLANFSAAHHGTTVNCIEASICAPPQTA